MAGAEFDFSEIRTLAADLGASSPKVVENVRKALEVTALHVKGDARKAANRTGLSGYAADITYELKATAGSVSAEIGPTPGDSGSFGFVEEGGGDVRSAPQHALRDALRKNEEDFVKGLLIATDDLL